MTSLETLNQALFLRLNADLATAAWKLQIAAITADYLIYLTPLMLVGLWCWGNESQRALALKACVVALVALGINQLLSIVWPHPRPFMIGLGHTFIPHAADSSFPSDHITVFAAIGLTLVFGYIRSVAGWATLALGVCVAWARIFLGVHFPLDMVGAVLIVCAVWLAISPAWRRFGERITEQAVGIYRIILAYPIAAGWICR
ncbi:MAG: phosphatase PAP2 family protein [Burkholderiaceae bacterium]